MSLFNNKKKEKKSVPTVGFDAIVKEFERIYPTQKDPLHFGTIISWELGGNDPLTGISVYDAGDYYHFVTFGMSELFDKRSKDKEISGFGMEFTFKLKKDKIYDNELEIKNVCAILQSLARITFSNGEIFGPNEYVYSGQEDGIDAHMKSSITGFITVKDPEVNTIITPNGKVDFILFVGACDDELQKVINNEISVLELYNDINSDVTSYMRKSIYG